LSKNRSEVMEQNPETWGSRLVTWQMKMLENRKPKIAILGATFETGNMGVGALTAGTIKCILSENPASEIFLLDYGKQSPVRTVEFEGRQVTVPLMNLRFSWKIFLPNNIAFLIFLASMLRVIPSKRLRESLVGTNRWLRQIRETDLVCSISGGDSFSDIYGLVRLLYVSLPQILALLLGKRLILLPQTIGPFRMTISKWIARLILGRAEKIYLREFRSQQEMEALLDHKIASEKLAFCYDVAFVLDPVAPQRLEVVGIPFPGDLAVPVVGLNVSGLLFMEDFAGKNMFGLRVNYKHFVHALLDLLIVGKGASVLLVPHVFCTRADEEGDQVVCEQIYSQLRHKYKGRLGFVRGLYNQSEIKHVIGSCDFFVGSRMHACIAAVSQNIPAVSVAYSEKFLRVMQTVGIENMVADARALGEHELLASVERAFDQRAAVRRQLELRMPQIRRAVLSLFHGLGGLLPEALLEGLAPDRVQSAG